jgi:nucleoside-diphosphate-sugar epimerase
MTDFKSKKFLVTGGAGFIGSWICEYLLQNDAQVTCLDNYSTGLKFNISHMVGHPKFTVLDGNLGETILDDNFGYILHFASRASPEDYQNHPIETMKVNALDTMRLLDYAKKNSSVFMFASSSEIYGNPQVVPTPETYYGNVNPIGAKSSYQESKRFAEAACNAYHKHYGVDVRIPRLFNTYGERLRPDGLYGRVISRFIMQALRDDGVTVQGDGKTTRSFCYISDTCEALIRILKNKETSGIAINVGNVDEISILELANIIIDMTRSKSKISFVKRGDDDADRRCPDIKTAMKVLEWTPKIGLKEGLHRTIVWIKHFVDNQKKYTDIESHRTHQKLDKQQTLS